MGWLVSVVFLIWLRIWVMNVVVVVLICVVVVLWFVLVSFSVVVSVMVFVMFLVLECCLCFWFLLCSRGFSGIWLCIMSVLVFFGVLSLWFVSEMVFVFRFCSGSQFVDCIVFRCSSVFVVWVIVESVVVFCIVLILLLVWLIEMSVVLLCRVVERLVGVIFFVLFMGSCVMIMLWKCLRQEVDFRIDLCLIGDIIRCCCLVCSLVSMMFFIVRLFVLVLLLVKMMLLVCILSILVIWV